MKTSLRGLDNQSFECRKMVTKYKRIINFHFPHLMWEISLLLSNCYY